MGITVKIEGVPEVSKVLQGMGNDAFKKRTMQAVYRKAGRTYVKAARAKAPIADETVKRYSSPGEGKAAKGQGKVAATYRPGNLKKSIGTWVRRSEKSPHLYLGARYGKRSRTYDGWYYRFVEFGTVNQPARPFLRPAWEQTQNKMSATMGSEFEKIFQKFKAKYKL